MKKGGRKHNTIERCEAADCAILARSMSEEREVPREDRLEIGPATEDDRIWAASVMSSSDPWLTLGRGFDHCLRVCRDPEYLVFVARQSGERCGVLVLQRRGVAGSPYVVSLAVAAEHRGRRLGAELLAFAEDRAREHSAHLFLCVSSFNGRARRFYETHGYAPIATLEDYVMPGASELLMSKRVRPA
jgi:ribosomal protein S18 acetylase RimI-like enzyme